ncbi:MAG: hypothetical protein ACREUX_07550 [Burkholderiales bacterium]
MDGRITAMEPADRHAAAPPPHPSIARAKHCRHCGRALGLLEHYSGNVCHRPECRSAHAEQTLHALRAQVAEAKRKPEPARFPIVVVPHREQRIAPVPSDRRTELARHLHALLDAPDPHPDAGAVQSPGDVRSSDGADAASEPVGAPVCSACRGFCCSFGGERFAFLDRTTLDRYAASNPGISPNEIVAAYVSRVPERAYKDSCLYHSRRGCVLPRSMRAALCNEYQCGPLKQGETILADAAVPGLFVVKRRNEVIAGGEFVSIRRRARRERETGVGANACPQAHGTDGGRAIHE